MPVKKFFKHFRYTRQVRKSLNDRFDRENDYTLATLTALDGYKPHEVKKNFKKSLKKFPRSVADILLEENKTPKDIGSVKLVEGFNNYLIDFAEGDRLKPDTIKKYIGL